MIDASIFRTWDRDLREGRRTTLARNARTISDAMEGTPFMVAVTGSLSRGQVHPWSDLDLLMQRRDGDEIGEEGRALRSKIVLWADFHDFDLVPMEDVPAALFEGILGSAVAVDDIPDLCELPDPRLAIARTAMSMRFALQMSRDIDDGRLDDEMSAASSEIDRLRAFSAMRPLMSKAGLWAKRLLVFQDGGRSAWLDDHDDEDALEEALSRLARPAAEPLERPAILTPDAAETLAFLLSDASVYGYAEDEDLVEALRATRRSIDEAVESLYGLEADHSTHGLSL